MAACPGTIRGGPGPSSCGARGVLGARMRARPAVACRGENPPLSLHRDPAQTLRARLSATWLPRAKHRNAGFLMLPAHQPSSREKAKASHLGGADGPPAGICGAAAEGGAGCCVKKKKLVLRLLVVRRTRTPSPPTAPTGWIANCGHLHALFVVMHPEPEPDLAWPGPESEPWGSGTRAFWPGLSAVYGSPISLQYLVLLGRLPEIFPRYICSCTRYNKQTKTNTRQSIGTTMLRLSSDWRQGASFLL